MAQFAIPLLFGEYLASLGLAATEAAVEVGISEGVAGVATLAATGYAVNFAGSQINDAVLNLIGSEKVEKVEKTFSELFEEAKAISSGESDFFLRKRREQIAAERQAQKDYESKKVIDFEKPVPDIVIHSRDNEDDVLLSGNQTGQDVALENVMGAVQTIKPSLPKVSTTDVIHFMTDYASAIVKQGLESDRIDKQKALDNTILKNPAKYIDVAKQLGSFLETKVPINEEYIKIAEVYNGRGLSIDKVSKFYDPEKKLIYFIFADEVGKEYLLYQTTGLILPAFPGTNFMGPNSPNKDLPVNLTDLYSLYHDKDYEFGPNILGDYKYISRLTQNYSRMDPFDQKIAKIGILYFSTMGNIVSRVIGGPLQQEEGLFEIVSDVPQENKDPFSPKVDYTEVKKTFYEDFHGQLQKVSAQKISNISNDLIVQEFGSLTVELL